MLLTLEKHFLEESHSQKIESLLTQSHEKLESLKNKTCIDAENTGWWNAPESFAFQNLEEIKNYVSNIDINYDLLVVIGIGGSYAGTRAIAEALSHKYAERTFAQNQRFLPIVYAGHHLCESELVELLELLEEHEPLVNVISKSGNTIEPIVSFKIIEEALKKKFGKDAKKRILVSTQEKESFLFNDAKAENYKTFSLPENVGGRFSVFTSSSLLPLTLASYPTDELLQGADRLFKELFKDATHPCLEYAAFRKAAWDEGKRIEILAFRNPKLLAFSEWWKQLFGESEGKDSKGLLPIGMTYTTDLHSLGQFVQEGPAHMIETFLDLGQNTSLIEKRVKVPHLKEQMSSDFHLGNRYVDDIDKAAWEASKTAHSQRVPTIGLKMPEMDMYSLGYMMAFFQVSCAVSALLLDVNPFNQPGVEVYKSEMRKLLSQDH